MINFLIPESNPEKETDLRSQGLGNDVICNAVNNIKPQKKVFPVVALGNMNQLFDYSGNHITAHQLANMIKSHPAYKKGLKVKLFVCNTGCTNQWYLYFAERLANYLGTTVYAPDGVLWVHPDGTTLVVPVVYKTLDHFDASQSRSKFVKFIRGRDVEEFELAPRFFRKKNRRCK